MKLSNIFPQIKTENKVQVKKTTDAPADPSAAVQGGGADRVELSAESRDVQKIRDILNETPEVRAEKIEALKQQIERGEYQVDSYQVADRMLMSLITDYPSGE